MKYQTKLTTIAGDKVRNTDGSFTIPTFEPLAPADGPAPPVDGSISDSNWSRAALADFDKAMEGNLAVLADDARKAGAPELNQFMPEVRELKKAELVIPALDRIEKAIAEELAAKQKALDFARNVERDAGEIAEPESEILALRHDLRAKEIRDAVRGMTPKERDAVLQRAIDEEDLFALNAMADSMVSLFSAYPHAVERAKAEVIKARHPWIAQLVEHNSHVAQAASTRAMQYTYAIKTILSKHGLDHDRVQQYRRALAKKAKTA